MKVLVAGSITRDTLVHEGPGERGDGLDHARLAPGGTAFYATNAYTQLGADVRVVTRVAAADDAWVRARFPRHVELHVQPSGVTTSFENHYRGDARSQRVTAVAPPIAFSSHLLDGIDWVHLGPLHPADLDRGWFELTGRPLALDVQGMVRRIAGERVVAEAAPDLARLLRRLHWLKAGLDEWQVVLEALGTDEAGFAARHPDIEVLCTEGRKGGAVLRADTATLSWTPMPVVDRHDPTGAGDVFFAAYLQHRVGRGAPAHGAAPAAAAWVSRFLMERDLP